FLFIFYIRFIGQFPANPINENVSKMENNQIQVMFFQFVKSKLPSHLSLVDELADLLEISIDSAYRRIRGEKIISLDEISKIASHFKLSVDQLLNLKASDAKMFTGNYVTPENFNFEMYL